MLSRQGGRIPRKHSSGGVVRERCDEFIALGPCPKLNKKRAGFYRPLRSSERFPLTGKRSFEPY